MRHRQWNRTVHRPPSPRRAKPRSRHCTSLGVSGEEYEKKYLLPFDPIEEELVQCRERGFALRGEGGRWRLTPEGLLLSNDIISDLMKLQEKSEPLAKRR